MICCQRKAGHSDQTAGDEPEEGGDDVKSSWPLCRGLHTCYNGRYQGLQGREREPIAKSRAECGLEAATRLHEAGSASNRGSATPRGMRSRAVYTPHVTPRKPVGPEVAHKVPKVWLVIGVKS